MTYFLIGYVFGILSILGIIWLYIISVIEETQKSNKITKGKVKFIDPITPKERFDRSEKIDDLLE